ncbi:MAG: cold shock domain-containing protein [Candidatus Pacebacteria bacterium]|nr:cold shock domain-containing protein [Candidatus Paceibacterota bacterium]
MSQRFRGTVRCFDQAKNKGYGYISLQGQRDVFVHYKQIVRSGKDDWRYLMKGERVEFSIGKDSKGRREAQEVKIVRD